MVSSVKNFRHFLLGRRFKIRTDHACLQWLLSFKSPGEQIARWLEDLFQYDFEIVYRSGQKHGNADSLSRRPCTVDNCKSCEQRENKFIDIEKSVFFTHACKTLVCAPFTDIENGLSSHQCKKSWP